MANRLKSRTHDERISDIVEALAPHHPTPMTLHAIAEAVGCSAELVRWHAKRSGRVVLSRERIAGAVQVTTVVRLAPQVS